MELVSGNKVEEIFDDVFSFYGMLNPDGTVGNLSGRVFEKVEINPEVLVGQNLIETVFWQTSENNASIVMEAVTRAKNGEKTKVLLDFRISAQNKIVIELNLHPIPNEEGRLEGIFFCAQEVTTREQEIQFYKEKSEQLLFAAENAEVGLWFWDLVKNKIYSTPTCNHFFEIPPEGTITIESFLDILHPEDRKRIENALMESQKYGAEYQEEYRVVYSNGEIHWISARGRSFLDSEGNPLKMMGVVQKITNKKLASEELSKVYAREKKARDEAVEANRAKDFFLAVVSHELRSPLNAILGWTKILLNRDIDTETQSKALETIEKSARSQAKILDDLLDSSRVASGRLKLEYRETNLFEIIKTVNNLQKPTADSKNIDMEISAENPEIMVYGDTIRLQQVISNLLSNALKFTPDSGKIRVEVENDKENVFVRVIDNGQGISQQNLPHIFRQFRQGDDKNDQGGLGLGLSIAKILVEKHKGKIWAESEGLGKGSTFTVQLPLYSKNKKQGKKASVQVSRPKKALEPFKILIVEDEPDSREVLQLFLEQNGAEVKSADSAQMAFEILENLENHLPDLIISDLAMPGQDGYTMLSNLRKFPPEKGGEIPALALSAFASVENKKMAIESGFQKYHTKPFQPDRIIQDILDLINN
ncbi:MAG: ATP-binding protein [Pyrinomonadaceae bacterium]